MKTHQHYYLINNKIKKGGEMPLEKDYDSNAEYKHYYNLWLSSLQPCEIDESELEKIKNKVYTFNNCHADNPIDVTDIVEEIYCKCNCGESFIEFKQPKQVESECEAVELNIKLTEYCHKCGDGCCTNYGTITEINGEELPCHNQDAETILKQVLEYLGYKVNIETVTDYD